MQLVGVQQEQNVRREVKRTRLASEKPMAVSDNYLDTDAIDELLGGADSVTNALPSLTELHLMQVSDSMLTKLLFASAATLESLYICSQTVAWALCPSLLPKVLRRWMLLIVYITQLYSSTKGCF